MKNIAGVYKYTHIYTGASYIGSAVNIKKRHREHLNPLAIDIAIANEGIENFTFEILKSFPIGTDKSILRENEREWIDYYDVENDPLHYNRPQGGPTKYNMWNAAKVTYDKSVMFLNNDGGNNPRRCFSPRNPANSRKSIKNIGRFNEPISPTIIYDFIQQNLS